VVKSAQVVYGRLLSLTPDCDGSLPYDVFDLLALEEDGTTTNMAKKKALRKLFRPDAKHELPFLDFLQSCDSLYKRLRFFRASVGNASVIDHVLESIIDGIFHFILALGLLSVMRFNPWPLLVSMSTLLVSISFAVGSSASKYIEGILLIAFRRPYDLGDRIYMTDPSQVNVDYNYCSSWFIEGTAFCCSTGLDLRNRLLTSSSRALLLLSADINLFYTTVRYAGTNEVATVNNGAISNMRIINGNRSPSAMVWFQLPFHISILDGNKLDKLKAALEKYAQDHPRSWHSFAYCRVDKYHVEIEQVVITIGFQHRSAWQDLTRILFAKSDLVAYTWRVAKNLDVCYEELPKRDLLYYAGELKDGGEKDYRRDLHHRDNIVSQPKGVASDQTAVSNDSANAMFLSQLRKSHM
jgi:small-conductance mechanosensitive channel